MRIDAEHVARKFKSGEAESSEKEKILLNADIMNIIKNEA